MTFMLLAWPPLGVLVAAGVTGLGDRARWRPSAAVWAGATLGLILLVKGLGSVDAPADARWYIRFPNANAATNPNVQIGLTPEERNDWVYFQSVETPDEVARERQKLSAALPWPATYLPLGWSFGRELDEMRAEVGTRSLTVLEIWGYIYGTRR